MNKSSIVKMVFVGNTEIQKEEKKVTGEFIEIDGNDFYKIANHDAMRPFFMTIVSHSDHWMFISSTGGLTAGRKNENSALFPYYTDDKISESFDITGSKTILRIKKEKRVLLWEPFSDRYQGAYRIKRNLYKSFTGNKIIFEEINEDLELTFKYSWEYSDKYGFVRKASLQNSGNESLSIDILDGLQNIIPYGVIGGVQNSKSNLVNAYKKSELDNTTGLGLFLLSAIIVDKAEPSEALKANTVWLSGLNPKATLLSSLQLDNYRQGEEIKTENSKKGERGAYFVLDSINLKAKAIQQWQLVAEVNQDHTAVTNLMNSLKNRKAEMLEDLEKDIRNGTEKLLSLVGKADGLELSNDKLNDARHYTNVLFNIMRGGIFDRGYEVDTKDFLECVSVLSKKTASQHSDLLLELNNPISYSDLMKEVKKTDDDDLLRIALEYLPLTFSRRHGDPSRPWNKFSIETRKSDGTRNLYYQGNWRDIFQNWEALACSYPDFVTSMIAKFVNATTIDGYNGYRITRDGIDWEVIDPEDPWSFIGYWGDHQIIYLLKLLEISVNHNPNEIDTLLNESKFVYANVPYRIKAYSEILRNPKDTILFDLEMEKLVESRVEKYGSDGKLVFNADDSLLRATLSEKLLLTLLTKISNLVPEGGIWLNTQRPEWNDANNALVGNGLSMVTLYYIRRYLSFLIYLFDKSELKSLKLNNSLYQFLDDINNCLSNNQELLSTKLSNTNRRKIMDELGEAGERYRNEGYKGLPGFEYKYKNKSEIIRFLKQALQFVDHSIKANKREDGLYHAYNLIALSDDSAEIEYLYEMLEGQVSVLTAGILDSKEVADLLDALKSSSMYREDQNSYLLYPDRDLPSFQEKNQIPKSFVDSSELVKLMLKNSDNRILSKDIDGNYHFDGTFTNAQALQKALEKLADTEYTQQVSDEKESFLKIYEEMFDHKSFTGRSGTFFGYEGLGSIYWHMVSKLLLAIQENIANTDQNHDEFQRLVDHYYDVREGIGVHKSPEVYGAIPTDPYSHTPGIKGAQQPGMTGQVKEDILNRWSEFGISIKEGEIIFNPRFLKSEEFLDEDSVFNYFDLDGEKKQINIQKGELAFTYCQVPIIYSKNNSKESIELHFSDSDKQDIPGNTLDSIHSGQVFSRSGNIKLIKVNLNSLIL